MSSAPGSGSTAAGGQGDVRKQLRSDLDERERRLRAMVARYKAKPSAIDSSLDVDDITLNVEATVEEIYHIMTSRVCSDDNPLQLNANLKEAFEAQEDEFGEFYLSAMTAIEAYKEVLNNYNLLKGDALPRPGRGDLPKIKDDVHVLIDERIACIKAIAEFHGKYAAMLAVLRAH
jgi:hypothetical protein